jgi:arylsulfatase A-like enzyme
MMWVSSRPGTRLTWRAVKASVIGVILATALTACSPPPRVPPATPHVVLIVVDTLRADHLSTYGYARPTSPNLERLALESIVFERAFTVMSHTLPAHISLVTGVHPATHQVLSNGWSYTGSYPALAERLLEVGYSTAGFVSGFPLDEGTGMERGFEVYEDTSSQDLAHGKNKIDGEITNARVMEWLHGQGAKPFFLFVHYFDTHRPFTTPENGELPFEIDDTLRARLEELGVGELTVEDVSQRPLRLDGRELTLPEAINAYDNEIRRVDGLIEEIRGELERLGFLDDTLLVVTSDHGEGLGQHSYFSHGLYLYEEQLRIPLIVRPPRTIEWAPARIESAVSLLDIVPTVLEVVGDEPDGSLHGISLSRILGERDAHEPRQIVAQRRRFPKLEPKKGGGRFAATTSLHALRGDSALKYLRDGDGVEELYDLGSDAFERVNLAAERPDDVARCRLELERLLSARTVDAEIIEPTLDQETREKLEALGYVQ